MGTRRCRATTTALDAPEGLERGATGHNARPNGASSGAPETSSPPRLRLSTPPVIARLGAPLSGDGNVFDHFALRSSRESWTMRPKLESVEGEGAPRPRSAPPTPAHADVVSIVSQGGDEAARTQGGWHDAHGLAFPWRSPLLRLLSPVCRDCGKTSDEARLEQFLDFQLCPACIRERERAVFAALPPVAARGKAKRSGKAEAQPSRTPRVRSPTKAATEPAGSKSAKGSRKTAKDAKRPRKR